MGTLVEVKLPDIGDFKDVDVIEILVKPGDEVRAEQSLITIESDKATTEVPSPSDGVVKELKVDLGDKVSEGSPLIILEVDAKQPATANGDAGTATASAPREAAGASVAVSAKPGESQPLKAQTQLAVTADTPEPSTDGAVTAAAIAPALPPDGAAVSEHKPHASPSVRKFARELGVDLQRVKGSGLNARIFRKDVEQFVKAMLTSPAVDGARDGGAALNLIPWPKVDFTRFGEIETKPLARIRKISKANLARNWVMIPHVTQFDEADVTELEAFRVELNQAQSRNGAKLTMLAFVLKALVPALSEFPDFNASLDGDNLILKKYFHFGFAVDTPDGLVVPVLRDVDKKGVFQIARETAELAAIARDRKLKPTDLQGGCFTVSSLGGIGGTAFTPIINAPEVAVLGLSRLARKPVYCAGAFVPRLMLPLSLSYDHRVIDGAVAARFIIYLNSILNDMRRALL